MPRGRRGSVPRDSRGRFIAVRSRSGSRKRRKSGRRKTTYKRKKSVRRSVRRSPRRGKSRQRRKVLSILAT